MPGALRGTGGRGRSMIAPMYSREVDDELVAIRGRVDVPAAVPRDSGGTTLGGYVAAALMGLVLGLLIAWSAR